MIELCKQADFTVSNEKYVEGVVYSPNQKDTDGQFMTQETIQKMSDRFMRLLGQGKADIDLLHNGIAGTGYLTKSMIDENGSWVVGVKVEDDSTWQAIKKGELRGFSVFGKSELSGNEIINPQVNKISIVSKPATKNIFQVVKSEKTLIQKGIDYLTSLIKQDTSTMDTNTIDQRLTALEEQMAKIVEMLSQDVQEDKQEDQSNVAKSESKDDKLATLEKINRDLQDQVNALTGKQTTQAFSKQTPIAKQEKEDVFAFMV